MIIELQQIIEGWRRFKCLDTESLVELFNDNNRFYIKETSLCGQKTSGKKRVNKKVYNETLLQLTSK